MVTKKFLLLLISLVVFLISRADEKFGAVGKYSIETNYQFGRIIPHNARFKIPVHGFTHAFELGFFKQTLGEKAWQRKLHYPELGGSFVFVRNEDQKIFGNVYLLLALAKFWIVRSRYIDFYVRVGTGLAFVPNHFDRKKNPQNIAIGSLINSADQLRLGFDFKASEHLQVTVGATFTHYSNAASALPNLGVNVPAFTMDVRYFPVVNSATKYNRNKIPKPQKKNEMMVKFGFAYNEMAIAGGAKYPFYIGTVGYARYTSIANKVLAGVCAEFSQGEFDLRKYSGSESKYSPALSASRFSIYAGDEILMGRTSIFFLAGAYVFNGTKKNPVYAKIGLNYYFPSFGKNQTTRFFVGINLKTHFLIAQYYETSTGIIF